jgi:hypothetical protein
MLAELEEVTSEATGEEKRPSFNHSVICNRLPRFPRFISNYNALSV